MSDYLHLTIQSLWEQKVHFREELLKPAKYTGIWHAGTVEGGLKLLKVRASQFPSRENFSPNDRKKWASSLWGGLQDALSDSDVLSAIGDAIYSISRVGGNRVYEDDSHPCVHFVADVLQEDEEFYGRADMAIFDHEAGKWAATIEARVQTDEHFFGQAMAAMVGLDVDVALMLTVNEFGLLYREQELPGENDTYKYYNWPREGLADIEHNQDELIEIIFELGRLAMKPAEPEADGTEDFDESVPFEGPPRVESRSWMAAAGDGKYEELSCFDIFEDENVEELLDELNEEAKDPLELLPLRKVG